MILMIGVPASEHTELILKFKLFPTVLATRLKGRTHHFLRVNLLKLGHLIVDDHLIGKQVEIRIFGVCDKGASERVEHKLFDKDGLVDDYKLGDFLYWYLVAYIHQTELEYLCQLLQKRMVFLLFEDLLDIVTNHLSSIRYRFLLQRFHYTLQ